MKAKRGNIVTMAGSNAQKGDTVTIDGTTYTFRNRPKKRGDIKIGATAAVTARNLQMAITGTTPTSPKPTRKEVDEVARELLAVAHKAVARAKMRAPKKIEFESLKPGWRAVYRALARYALNIQRPFIP